MHQHRQCDPQGGRLTLDAGYRWLVLRDPAERDRQPELNFCLDPATSGVNT